MRANSLPSRLARLLTRQWRERSGWHRGRPSRRKRRIWAKTVAGPGTASLARTGTLLNLLHGATGYLSYFLTLGSVALDVPAYGENVRRVVGTHSDSARRSVRVRDAAKEVEAPDVQAALVELYRTYAGRRPVQVDLKSTLRTTQQRTICNSMLGLSDFIITDTLKHVKAWPSSATSPS